MYHLTIKISGEQRKALYKQVRNRLAGLGDVFVALECQKDYPTAERLAIEFGEDFRLMVDLGWNPEDGRDDVELTMPPHDLMEVAKRLRDEAQGGLVDVEEDRKSVSPPLRAIRFSVASLTMPAAPAAIQK